MTEKRFKSRCYEKQKNVVIYDKGDKLFDVSYRDFEDAYYLKMKLSPVIDKLNELSEENSKLHTQNDFLKDENQHMRDLVNENRQLKQQLEDCKDVNVRCCNDYSAMRRDVWKYKKENEQLKQDKIRLIGFLHRCGYVDVEEVDESILSKDYYDSYGELYYD